MRCVRRGDGASASRCALPLSTLRRGQVLVALSEGVYAPLGGASVPVVHGHRTRTDLGRVPSFETGVSVSDCPAGATNFAWTIIDAQQAAQESRGDRRNLVQGYGIFICANSATRTLPATAKHLIESLTITN